MKIYNSIVSWIIKKRIHHIELFINYPHEVQGELRQYLIDTAKNTEFGKIYDFNLIKNSKDFSTQIPLSTYEDLEPFIKRMRSGEQNILWPTEISWFAKSSGTTNNKSKYIPVSSESIEDCHYKGGKDLLSIYCNNYPAQNIFEGKSLMLGGSHSISTFSNKMHEGDLSAIIMENLPFWVQLQQSPAKDIALMDEWEKKIELMVEQAVHEDISSFSGIPSWALVFAEKVLEKTGKNNLHEVWPNLELYMHGGINFDPYKKQFERLFPKGLNYIETYNASEGFFGIQNQPNSNEMLLMLDYGIYYEFIPLRNTHESNPQTIQLNEIVVGEDYEMIISTNAGLWRYRIGDTIKFTHQEPYRFIISGRTKHFINAFGEELMIHNAEKAIQIACEGSSIEVVEFTAAPKHIEGATKAYHEWLIEFKDELIDLNAFTTNFDLALQSLNSDYEAKRHKDMILICPKIHCAKKNLFFNWMKKRGKLGGQNKVPRLSNNRDILEELLEFQREFKGVE
jgi:hypothetical protein